MCGLLWQRGVLVAIQQQCRQYHKSIGVAADGVDCAVVECLKVPSKQTHKLHRKRKTVAAQVALRHATCGNEKCHCLSHAHHPITNTAHAHNANAAAAASTTT